MVPDLRFDDRAVYDPVADTLVVADVHLGRSAASNVSFPVGERADLVERLTTLVERYEPAEFVVAGDLLHAFDAVGRSVEESYERMCAVLEDAAVEFVVTPGNHDAMLEVVHDGKSPVEHRLGDGATVVCHGHELPSLEANRYLVGHDHPALRIDGRKHPCFLAGDSAVVDAQVVVLPAFSRVARGTAINRRRASNLQSPLLDSIEGFRPVIRDVSGEETLWFPPLGACRSVL